MHLAPSSLGALEVIPHAHETHIEIPHAQRCQYLLIPAVAHAHRRYHRRQPGYPLFVLVNHHDLIAQLHELFRQVPSKPAQADD